ncbi:MAG: elongation factor P [Candidatus Binatia bacterium]|nr:MAG: elongation factor P [Candidatus Binatia bacterium]
MATVLPSDFRRGMALVLDGAPHLLEDFYSSGTAKFKQKVHARLRHLRTGRILERTFADNEQVEVAELEQRRVQYSYKQDTTYVFLDAETFEPYELTEEQLGDRRWFLKENEEYAALFLEGRILDVVLPAHVVLEVVETGPAQRGTADSTWKPAKLETGLEIMVPLFIESGEKIRVDPNERKYVGRESTGKKG